jgi:hypothetical protein
LLRLLLLLSLLVQLLLLLLLLLQLLLLKSWVQCPLGVRRPHEQEDRHQQRCTRKPCVEAYHNKLDGEAPIRFRQSLF